MKNFRVHYSGACFETGDSPGQVEKRVHDKVASLGEIFGIEATLLHSDKIDLGEENYVSVLKARSRLGLRQRNWQRIRLMTNYPI